MISEKVNETSIGFEPEWLWRYNRAVKLSKAIDDRLGFDSEGSYIHSPIPNEWFLEYGEHIHWLSKNKPEQLIEFLHGT